jgi:dTDP-glucose 4,6-dehydratase
LSLQIRGVSLPFVTVLTRSPEKFLIKYPEFSRQAWLRFVAGDILRSETLPMGEKFTHVLHAAADSTIGPSLMPIERHDQIVTGTRNILDFTIRSGAKRFLLASSGGVYGRQPPDVDRLREDRHTMPDPLDPGNTYGVAKREAEHLCALYAHTYSLEATIARCFAFVGPDLPLDAHFAIGNFIRDALWASEIAVAGDGTPLRSYMYQDELARWLITILHRAPSLSAYNVGSDEAISIAELATLVRNVIAPRKSVRILNAATCDHERNRYVPDISKAREELGLGIEVPLQDAIETTADILSRQKCTLIHGPRTSNF